MRGKTEQEILLIGAGGHGSELGSYIRALAAAGERVRLIGFVDENKPPGPFCGSKTLGGFDALEAFLRKHPENRFHYLTATGDNSSRAKLVKKIEHLRAKNLFPWTLRHPNASVGQDVVIGEGSCLAPGSTMTTRIRFGRHGILNVHASISHDCVVGEFANINPGATLCGNVTLGKGCNIGAGATVIEKISIGDWSTIGAGAVVIQNIPPHATAVGVPARVIKTGK